MAFYCFSMSHTQGSKAPTRVGHRRTRAAVLPRTWAYCSQGRAGPVALPGRSALPSCGGDVDGLAQSRQLSGSGLPQAARR